MAFQIQYRGEWGGALASDWAPAVTGTVNQTGESNESASTFESRDVAEAFLDDELRPQADPDRVEFRVLKID